MEGGYEAKVKCRPRSRPTRNERPRNNQRKAVKSYDCWIGRHWWPPPHDAGTGGSEQQLHKIQKNETGADKRKPKEVRVALF